MSWTEDDLRCPAGAEALPSHTCLEIEDREASRAVLSQTPAIRAEREMHEPRGLSTSEAMQHLTRACAPDDGVRANRPQRMET